MKKIWTLPAVTLLAAGALTACGTDTAQEPEAAPTPIEVTYNHYVAIGDSYAALGSRDAATSGPETCLRSADNYPALIGQHERVEVTDDLSCSGAVTDDVVAPSGEGENMIAPQVDALSPETDLVTVSIGGNDINFPVFAQCFQDAILSGEQSDCSDEYDNAELLAGVDEKLANVYSTITERAPSAYVYVTGYLPLLSAEGECTDAAFVSEADRAWAVDLTNQLNEHIAQVAGEHGLAFVMPENAEDHTVCAAPEERWTDLTGIDTDGYPMHPTPLGQEAMADAVMEKL
ncbi:SGNH/GDSL hydrolase family protein [Corynebacterium lubricantis]|uniref:SGNH/GDSL hydrolase family protein n=1 Tax=Corynebacterium lubricantis TaxID=541095 RepID=UPI00035EA144|nr:SGNH/GDSL hydrolase family protein [Corynebacterium lubricantis]